MDRRLEGSLGQQADLLEPGSSRHSLLHFGPPGSLRGVPEPDTGPPGQKTDIRVFSFAVPRPRTGQNQPKSCRESKQQIFRASEGTGLFAALSSRA